MEKVNYEEFKELQNGNNKVFIDFYADWCGPCKMMMPVLETVSEEFKDSEVTFVKVNADEERELSAEFGVRGIPTFVMIDNGEIKERYSGVQSKQHLIETIKESLNV
jgi:thioredoxin 1